MLTHDERIRALEDRLRGTAPQGPTRPGLTSVREFRPYDLAEEFQVTPNEVCAVLSRVMRE